MLCGGNLWWESVARVYGGNFWKDNKRKVIQFEEEMGVESHDWVTVAGIIRQERKITQWEKVVEVGVSQPGK